MVLVLHRRLASYLTGDSETAICVDKCSCRYLAHAVSTTASPSPGDGMAHSIAFCNSAAWCRSASPNDAYSEGLLGVSARENDLGHQSTISLVRESNGTAVILDNELRNT